MHFIFPWQMGAWCADAGLRIDRHVGLFHDWGWGEWCATDMKQRIGYALRDQGKTDPAWEKIAFDLERMRAYLDAQGAFFEGLLRDHVRPLLAEVPVDVLGTPLALRDELAVTELGAEVREYLADARVRYAATPPLNALGATSLYFCRPV